ncbi:BAL_1a_G0007860.mRNA.1.CDS.1 [Saccharomyces cerevisiae]|nr:BAL_1a_G0007860.mRNA.1.CDS.1 [Saccharomyces cerevisiae]CAI7064970.1 BAL_1a_G0007860.mRNA.1.CDS.1 [Saccharomyces cerevisiae]
MKPYPPSGCAALRRYDQFRYDQFTSTTLTPRCFKRAALSVRIYRRAVPAADLRKIGSPFVAISCNLNKHSLKNTGAIRTLLHTSISVSTILRGRDLKIISRLKR